LPAIHSRHHYIQNNDIGPDFRCHLQRREAIVRMEDLVKMWREISFEELVNGLIIIDHQHLGRIGLRQTDHHSGSLVFCDFCRQPTALPLDEEPGHLLIRGGRIDDSLPAQDMDLYLTVSNLGLQGNFVPMVVLQQAAQQME